MILTVGFAVCICLVVCGIANNLNLTIGDLFKAGAKEVTHEVSTCDRCTIHSPALDRSHLMTTTLLCAWVIKLGMHLQMTKCMLQTDCGYHL